VPDDDNADAIATDRNGPDGAARYLTSGRLVIDRKNKSLALDGREVTLSPTPFRVLELLMDRAQTLVSKDELLDGVWDKTTVSEDALTSAVRTVRQALGDSVRQPEFIKTVSRRGYMFLGAVDAVETPPGQRSESGRTGSGSERLATRWQRVAAIAGGGIALIAVVALLTVPRFTRVPAPSGFAEFILADTTARAIEDERPGFLERLQRAEHRMPIVSDAETGHYRQVEISLESGSGGSNIGLAFHHGGQETVFSRSLDIDGQSGPAIAERVTVAASFLSRCVDDILPAMSAPRRDDPRMLASVYQLCDASRTGERAGRLEPYTEEILTLFPDEPGAAALHALMLVAQPDQHLHGQVDVRMDANTRRARELLDFARTDPNAADLVRIGDQILTARNADLHNRERLLAEISPETWPGIKAHIALIALYSLAGRLAEAEYLASHLTELWPGNHFARTTLALSQSIRGPDHGASQTIDAALQIFPESRALIMMHDINLSYYGDPEQARANQISTPPPHISACIETFHDARAGLRDGLGDRCDQMDITQRARMLAILGDVDAAIAMAERFSPEAVGAGKVLHYPEFFEAWKSPRMWDVARRFGLVDYWRQTGTMPDICFAQEVMAVCEREILAED
jgi:DNA-binding winged helix-turn-helix (wHTH) protein